MIRLTMTMSRKRGVHVSRTARGVRVCASLLTYHEMARDAPMINDGYIVRVYAIAQGV